MRLLVLSQYFWPENFRVNDLVAELVRRGHEVTVLTGEPNYPEGHVHPDYRRDPARFSRYSGAEVVRVPLIPRGRGSVRLVLNYLSFAISGLTLGVWRLRGRPFDAIFVFQPSPITSALPALLLRRLKRAPTLLWVLDLWPDTLSAVGVIRSPTLLGLVGRLVSFIYRGCDMVLGQSQAFIPRIEQDARGKAVVRYFPGWAEAELQQGGADVAPAPESAPHEGAFKIVFTGNIGESQDFPAVLDAAEALRDEVRVHWLVVGDGRAAEWLRAEIIHRSLQATVFMLGRYPLERMPSFFATADALLVSLKKDPIFSMTIPGKLQAYLAAGRPILGMLDGEGARVIDASGAGFSCPAGNGLQLANLARKLAALPAAERACMGTRARDYTIRQFDRASLITQLESWITALNPDTPDRKNG